MIEANWIKHDCGARPEWLAEDQMVRGSDCGSPAPARDVYWPNVTRYQPVAVIPQRPREEWLKEVREAAAVAEELHGPGPRASNFRRGLNDAFHAVSAPMSLLETLGLILPDIPVKNAPLTDSERGAADLWMKENPDAVRAAMKGGLSG